MPAEISWHVSLPVLVMTYSGTLTISEYHTLCDRRLKLLEQHQGPAILVADLSQLEEVQRGKPLRPSILHHPQVHCTLVVLPDGLYHRLTRTMLPHQDDWPVVQIVPSPDDALALAEQIAAGS